MGYLVSYLAKIPMGDLKLLDLNLSCPLNIVKKKISIGKINSNEDLLVELDKGEREMVQNNLKEMGYLFVQIEDTNNSVKLKILNEKDSKYLGLVENLMIFLC